MILILDNLVYLNSDWKINHQQLIKRSDFTLGQTKDKPWSVSPTMNFLVWRWFVLVALVSSQVTATGQSVPDLNTASLGWTGVSVCPLPQGLCTWPQTVVSAPVFIPDFNLQIKVCGDLQKKMITTAKQTGLADIWCFISRNKII